MIGCASNDFSPNRIVLIYGDSSISAVIQDNNVFEGINDTEKETVAFSGTVTQQENSYLIDFLVARETKGRKISENIKTAVTLKGAEPVEMAGFHDASFTLMLKK